MSTATSTIGIKLALSGDRQTETGIRRVTQSMNDMGGSAKEVSGYLANMLGVALGGASFGAMVGKLVEVQREFDVLNSSLITVTGSSAQAEKEFGWIRQFASTTPYALQEVTQAFVKMKALGLDGSKESLASFGNTASAMGKSLDQMIEAVADASTGEFERLKEFGIKTRQQGDEVTFTFRGVSTTVKKSSDEIVSYLQRIGEVDFAGAMEERAKTLDGTLSNLADSWDRLFLTAGQGGLGQAIGNDAKNAATTLDVMSEAMENARKSGGGLARQLGDGLGVALGRLTFGTVAATAETFNGAINLLTGNLFDLSTNIDLLPDNLRTTAEQASIMARKIKEAEVEYAALQARSKVQPDNIYLKSEMANLFQYIEALKAARQEKMQLMGQFAGGGRGFVAPQTVGQLLAEEEKRASAQKEAYDKLMERLATPNEKLQSELTKQRDALGPLFTPEVERRIRASFAKKDSGVDKNKITAADVLAVDMADIERTLGQYTSAYKNAQDVVSAAQAAGLLSDREYYEAQLGFINLNSEARLSALQRERDRLEQEKLTGAERLQQLQRIADIEAEMGVVRQDAATQTEVLNIQEGARLKRLVDGYNEAKLAAQAYLDTLQLQYARELEGVGKGDKARRLASGLNQIDDRYESQRQGLAGERRRGEITEEDYRRQLALIDNYNAMALDAYRQHYADLDAAQGNWLNGANDAFANYRDNAANIAGQTSELFTSAFQGMEDALVTFVTTGKLSFTDLANGIVADITRIIIKQQISNALGLAGGAGGSGLLGLVGAGIGSLFGTGGQVAVASAMGGNAMDNLMNLTGGFGTMSFDGGGHTGNGPRSGGLDGKGGFWAMLHPQETVVDHTKGQSMGRPMTVINQFAVTGPVNRQTEAQLAAAAQRGLMRGQRNL